MTEVEYLRLENAALWTALKGIYKVRTNREALASMHKEMKRITNLSYEDFLKELDLKGE